MDLQRISSIEQWNICLNLLLDDSISEVESNGPSEFFIKRQGKRIKLDDISFPSIKSYTEGIKEGLVPHVRSIHDFDENSYLFEAPLEYSAGGRNIKGRCHIVLSPAADSPQVTIAKKSTSLARVDDIAAKGSMSTDMLVFLKACVQAGMTMVFSGGTGAGKTTMLEALTKLIPDSSRIGVAEDTPELVLTQPNVSYLHSVPWKPGMDPNNVATLSWVVQQYQRMRTDRIIVGETRGKEFADFLVAANSGMAGSFTTIHAEDPIRCLDKMTNFAIKGSEGVPIRSINTDIANAIDIIVQLIILPDGRHKIGAIQEITPTIGSGDDARIATAELWKYDVLSDSFVKGMHLSDRMRKKFAERGVNYERFLASTPGTSAAAHSGEAPAAASAAPARSAGGAPPRAGGLPTSFGRRSL
jgi:pilus assembly protein CpaF